MSYSAKAKTRREAEQAEQELYLGLAEGLNRYPAELLDDLPPSGTDERQPRRAFVPPKYPKGTRFYR